LNNTMEKEQVLDLCKILSDKKAADIIAIDVADKTIIAEWFIICSGRSVPHVKTLCDAVEEKCGELNLEVRRKEGYSDGRWIVLDFAHILVHIFHPDERQYYNMERLWIDEPESYIDYSQLYDSEE
jgi:ribosome-associated protein